MTNATCFVQVSLVSKDASMLDGLDNASIEMEEAKVWLTPLDESYNYIFVVIIQWSSKSGPP